jgi:uncharacterized protein (TIGR03437 family)
MVGSGARIGYVCALLTAAPLAAQPSINPSGVVNAASYSSPGLPNSGIAQGSVFIVLGKNLGPSSTISASFPVSTTLGGTSAQVTVNGVAVSPLMIYTSASQVAMLMPSSTPTGNGTITVTYNGQISSSAAVQVVGASFGTLTLNQGGNGPAVVTDATYAVISLTHAANPGQTLTLWGTGLGKISADETQAPPQGNVGSQPTVWVGSQQASVFYWGRAGCCAGLDQINFQVPAGVTGCYVPLAVQTGGTVSNFGSIAVTSGGGVCSDPVGLGSAALALVQSGQNLNVATLSLSRAVTASGGGTTTTDSGSASFVRYTPSQIVSSSFGQAVSVGYCSVFPINGTPAVTDPVKPLGLDAGTVEVGGSNGTKILIPVPGSKGYYNSTLGSSYLDPSAGPHTFNMLGGADVGPSSVEDVQSLPALVWANQATTSTVSELQGVTVKWTNASPDGYVRVTGYSFSLDQSGNFAAGARFFCTANPGQGGTGQFTVPPPVLLSLPVSASGSVSPSGSLGVISQSAPFPVPVTLTRGLDAGYAHSTFEIMQNVTYTP